MKKKRRVEVEEGVKKITLQKECGVKFLLNKCIVINKDLLRWA